MLWHVAAAQLLLSLKVSEAYEVRQTGEALTCGTSG